MWPTNISCFFPTTTAIALVERPADVEMTITGGEHFCHAVHVGSIAKDSLSRVIATSCILVSAVISAANGITTTLHQEREINNIMLHNCEGKHIVAADPQQNRPFAQLYYLSHSGH